MSDTPVVPQIDVTAIRAEVDKMDETSVRQQLLEIRTRQKTQQKKNAASGKQKEYQLKQREKNKLLAQRARELGIYDSINEQAEQLAEAKLAAQATEGDEE
jgi:hypothetical protein